MRPDEKPLSAADAAKVEAAALKAVPGGTVCRVETDAGEAAYEAHMTKADGTPVTVKLDKNFDAVGVENGMGKGDPPPPGAPARGLADEAARPRAVGETYGVEAAVAIGVPDLVVRDVERRR